jgi:hypothetical protein
MVSTKVIQVDVKKKFLCTETVELVLSTEIVMYVISEALAFVLFGCIKIIVYVCMYMYVIGFLNVRFLNTSGLS